jgi:hypothetical protein
MKTHDPLTVVNALMNADANGQIARNDRCCGESGTFAVSRPDIATQVRFRKQQEMEKGAARLRQDGFQGEVKVLTSCPILPAGTQALRRRRRDRRRLRRRGDGAPPARAGLARRLRPARQRRRHRARAAVKRAGNLRSAA